MNCREKLKKRESRMKKRFKTPEKYGNRRTEDNIKSLIPTMLEDKRIYRIKMKKLLKKYQVGQLRLERLMTDAQYEQWRLMLEQDRRQGYNILKRRKKCELSEIEYL